MLLWLWCRPADAALIQPLAQELPYAIGATMERKKKKKTTIELAYDPAIPLLDIYPMKTIL